MTALTFRHDHGDYFPHRDFPAGLLGDIAQYILDASPRPVREIALCAALGMLAGITGRSHNVSNVGLNIYMLLLADSGSGKDVMSTAVDRLVAAAARIEPGVEDFFCMRSVDDPDDLTNHLRKRSPSCVAILPEFGLKMKREPRVRANNRHQNLRTFLLETYTRSGSLDRIMLRDGPLTAPSVTVIGEGAPEHAMPRLGDPALNDGFFGRFTVIEPAATRAPPNWKPTYRPPSDLAERVAALASMSKALNDSDQHGLEVNMSEEAEAYLRAYSASCDATIRRNREPVSRTLWARSYIKACKLAALAAVGADPANPIIDLETAKWACEYDRIAIEHLLLRIGCGATPAEHLSARRRNKIREVMTKFQRGYYQPTDARAKGGILTAAHVHDGVIPLTFLDRVLKTSSVFKTKSPDDLKSNLREMIDYGEIELVYSGSAQKVYGVGGAAYRILNLVNENTAVREAPFHPDELHDTKEERSKTAK